MTPNEEIMELSLNIAEEENCTFITSNLLEQSENFDEWLDKNGVHYIISNERHSDNTASRNNCQDPLLNQLNAGENEAEVMLQTEVKFPGEIPNFTGLTSKYEYLHFIFKKGIIYVEFMELNSPETNENKINLIFSNSKAKIVFPTSFINLNDGRQLSAVPQERLPVISIEKMSIANDLEAIMPCLTLSTGFKLYICPQIDCQTVYTRLAAAKLHSLMQLGHKPFKCPEENCTWAFYTSFKLRRHQESHLNIKDFVCTVTNCGRKFTNIYNLNIHFKNHSKPATLPCPVKGCVLKFQTSRVRERHFKTHDLSEAPFVCPEENCSRAFFLMTGLQSHARSHAYKESDVRCDFPNCGKVFKLPCRLREHRRAHTGQRPYVCDFEMCTWSFTSSSKLRRHQSSHKNERKFHCTIGDCSKSFLRPEHLKEHTITHIGPRIYTCEICSETFYGLSGKTSLYLHVKKAHPEVQECARALPVTIKQEEEEESENQSLSEGESQQQPEQNKPTADMLLEQAIQSLGVPSDMILGTGLIPEESLELLENGNFSTVNLRDLE